MRTRNRGASRSVGDNRPITAGTLRPMQANGAVIA